MVKYDPILGAFRTIDDGSVSQNGNTDTIFAGSGLITRINETGFQTNWSPDFTNKNLSDVLFSVMQRFDNDEKANVTAHLDFVRRLDALENGNSGGAADITVNGVSPDPKGNIQLSAENISFNLKDSMDDDIPTSPAISNMNLQEFFTTLQYAIFSVNGHCAYIDPSNPTAVQGDISIYGNTMYLITEDDVSPGSDWDGNPLNRKTVYELAQDVYIHSIKEISTDGGKTYSTAENGKLNLTINCPASGWVASAMGGESGSYYPLAEILDFLSRYSIYTINGMSVYDEDIGDINLTANDIPMKMVDDGMGNLSPDWTIGEAMDFKAGYPYFYSPETREINTEYYEQEPGYLIVRVKFTSAPPEAPVTIEFNDNVIAKLQPGSAGEWQTFVIPSAYDRYIVRTPTPNVGTIWNIEVEFLTMNA